jgi:hypothetical protein
VVPLQPRHPECGAFSHRRKLGRLEMGIRKARKTGVSGGECLERAENRYQTAEQQSETVAHDHQIGIVGHERTGCPKVEVRARRRCLIAERMDVRHHIMAEAPLVACGDNQIGVIEMSSHLSNSRLWDVESQLTLGFGQGQPEPAPKANAVRLAPKRLHGGRGIAGAERRVPPLVGHRKTRSVKVI